MSALTFEALRRLADGRFHSGEDIARSLKRSILLTASPDSLIGALSGQVKAVVQKPFEAQQLIDAVRQMSET